MELVGPGVNGTKPLMGTPYVTTKNSTVPVGSGTPVLDMRVAVRVNAVAWATGLGTATSVPVTGLVVMLLARTVMPPVFTSGLGVSAIDDAVAPPRASGLEMVTPPLATTRSNLLVPVTGARLMELMPWPARKCCSPQTAQVVPKSLLKAPVRPPRL